jgi:hypothetical protein
LSKWFPFVLLQRRVGRVVDCGSLENCWLLQVRGFESPTLRIKRNPDLAKISGFFDLKTKNSLHNYIARIKFIPYKVISKFLDGNPHKKRCQALQGYRLLSKKSKPSASLPPLQSLPQNCVVDLFLCYF